MNPEPTTAPALPSTLPYIIRLEEAIASYLQAKDAGRMGGSSSSSGVGGGGVVSAGAAGEFPDPEDWIARYPEVAEGLRAFFADEKRMEALAGRKGEPALGPVPNFKDYQVLEAIGPGGMGMVYKAHRRSTKSTVALKVIRPDKLEGLSAERRRKIIQRFIIEAQAAAQLEHDHLVKVYEVGEEGGRPFYSMRYIEGSSLNDMLEAGPLEPRRAAGYLEPVARAVHEAHRHGILHRDLKPHNILVESESDRPLAADWGLAKLLQREPGEPAHDDPTPTGAVMGTPAYMSPEQANNSANVTVASDVYGLGATLYALLTGRPPFEAPTLIEILQKVIAEEPIPPRTLQPTIPLDLETICLKCLEKEPERRYADAEALARDLQDFLDGKPIEARPVGTIERAWLWCRPKPVVAGLTTAVAASLLIGSCVSTAFAIRADKAREGEEQQRIAAEANAERAEAMADLGQRTIEAMTSERALAALRTSKGLTQQQKDFLRQAVEYYSDVSALAGDDKATRQRRGLAYLRMGFLQAELGEKPAAERAYRRALDIQEKLAADFPSIPEYSQELAVSHNNLGALFTTLGARPAAEQAFRRALDIQQKLAADFPNVPEYAQKLGWCYNNLGILLVEYGRRPAAEQSYHKALDIQEKLTADFPNVPEYLQELAGTHNNLGTLLAALGQRQAAEHAYRRALDIQEKLAAHFASVPEYRQELARSHNNMGTLLAELGEHSRAEQAFRRALDIRGRLVADFPSVPAHRKELAAGHGNLGRLLKAMRQWPAAEQAYRQALDIEEQLVAGFHSVPEYRQGLGRTCVSLGILLRVQGQAEASLPWYAKGIALLEPLVQQEPSLITERLMLRNAHGGRAQALDEVGRHADAVKEWDRALALNAAPADDHSIRIGRALSLLRAGDHTRAVAEANALAQEKEVTGDTLYDLACVCAIASAKVKDAKDPVADATRLAEEYAARAVELLRQAVAKGYKHIEHMKKDKDLDALREREDFKKLVAELEGKLPPATRIRDALERHPAWPLLWGWPRW